MKKNNTMAARQKKNIQNSKTTGSEYRYYIIASVVLLCTRRKCRCENYGAEIRIRKSLTEKFRAKNANFQNFIIAFDSSR